MFRKTIFSVPALLLVSGMVFTASCTAAEQNISYLKDGPSKSQVLADYGIILDYAQPLCKDVIFTNVEYLGNSVDDNTAIALLHVMGNVSMNAKTNENLCAAFSLQYGITQITEKMLIYIRFGNEWVFQSITPGFDGFLNRHIKMLMLNKACLETGNPMLCHKALNGRYGLKRSGEDH